MLVSKTGMHEYKFHFTLIISHRPCKQKSKDQAITLNHYASLDVHKYVQKKQKTKRAGGTDSVSSTHQSRTPTPPHLKTASAQI